MIVLLKNNWFAPEGKHIPDKMRVFSGQFFSKGEHVMPDMLFDFLPASAKVIEAPNFKKVEKEIPVPVKPSFKDFDMDRASAEKEVEINNEVHDRLKKAREAKAAKAAAKQAKG